MSKSIILNNKQLEVSLDRLACQLLENHNDFTNTVLVGLQSSGIKLCNKILYILKNKYKIYDIDFGYLDITFFRDDFRRNKDLLLPNKTYLFCISNRTEPYHFLISWTLSSMESIFELVNL